MTQSKLKSQLLFLCSDQASHRNDTPWHWSADIEPDVLAIDRPDERMTLTLEGFSTVYDWDWIPADASFVLRRDGLLHTDTTVRLPRGNPVLQDLARDIDRQIPKKDVFGNDVGLTCQWNRARVGMQFVNTGGYEFELFFPDLQTAAFLGFTDVHVRILEYEIKHSDQPIRPLPVESIYVHLVNADVARDAPHLSNAGAVRGAQQPNGNLLGASQHTPLAGTAAVPNNLLGVVRMTAQPYTMLVWRNKTDAFQVALEGRQLTRLTFALTDWQGAPLTMLGRNYLTLRVDTWAPAGVGTHDRTAWNPPSDVSNAPSVAMLQAIQADTRFLRSLKVAEQVQRVLLSEEA